MKYLLPITCLLLVFTIACSSESVEDVAQKETSAPKGDCSDCPDWDTYHNYIPDSIDSWSPYDGTDTLVFEDIEGTLLVFNPYGVRRDTGSREVHFECDLCDRTTTQFIVEKELTLFANLEKRWDLRVDKRHDILNCWLGQEGEFWIGGYYDGTEKCGRRQPPNVVDSFHPTITLNGSIFSNVYAFLDTFSNKALYFNETQGIVGFVTPDESRTLYSLKQ